MATLWDICQYYRRYWPLSLLSVGASSLFEVLDLAVPYAIGQILNVLSGQSLDQWTQGFVEAIASLTDTAMTTQFSLLTLLGVIFLVTVAKAPVQPWLGDWFHWLIPLAARRDHQQLSVKKVLTLPLEFYDENNPGRVAGRVARGLANHTWTYPEIAGQLIPKVIRLVGIFAVLWMIQWRIALLFVLSFFVILAFTLPTLKQLTDLEEIVDRYQENTE
ncbi:MAG: ABC transporter ATP-binding protein, partial [Oscillatoriales cyanobacterium RM1_1_9]|nr:ABC transporter ATP-binding protein [Oscillatoriales cyanobacterium RM1_1_9]